MVDQPANATSDDWHDRLVDHALAEAVGGETPPDLAADIVASAQESTHLESGELAMATNKRSKFLSIRGWALAASVIVNLGLAALLLRGGERSEMVVQRSTEVDASATTSAELPTQRDGKVDFDDTLDVIPSAAKDSGALGVQDKPPGELRLNDLQSQAVVDGRASDDLGIEQEEAADSPVAAYLDNAELKKIGKESEAKSLGARNKKLAHGLAFGDGAAADPIGPTKASPKGEIKDFYGTQDFGVRGGRLEGLALLPSPQVRHDWVDSSGRSLKEAARGEVEFDEQNFSKDVRFHGFAAIQPDDAVYDRLSAVRYRRSMYARWELGSQPSMPGRQFEQWHGSEDGDGIGPGASGDKYERIYENPFVPAIGGEAVSTFSVDVDTASYANVRQMLQSGHMPPADAVRLEELVNYFDYGYEGPSAESEAPFAAHVETAECPWQPKHRLVRIGVKGREVATEKRPQSNLVFLVDISGSMNSPEKLPLVVHGMTQLAQQLGENDRVAIVVYASSEGLVLPSTPGTEQATIVAALENLRAGGSTAGGAGIKLAYQIAEDNFIEGGVNRVILCTDGDFNVGTTSTSELERLVEKKAKDTGVFLSCIGFGRGNLNDAMMEKITGIGNGNYYYVDGERESERVFVKGMTGMLVTIAKDVKIQIEFNPTKVAGYRLLGYENRMLETQDFNDDKKDAGEIGAGHTVTCLYEIVPMGEEVQAADIDELKYQSPASFTTAAESDELLTLKMRYKKPDEDVSTKLEWPANDSGESFGEASDDLQFAAAAASFGMLLRDSQHKGDASYDAVLEIAQSAIGEDSEGERAEFVELVKTAKNLAGQKDLAKETKPASDATEEE